MSRTFTKGVSRPSRIRRRLRQPWRWMPFTLRLHCARLRNAIFQRRLLQHAVRVAVVLLVVGLLVGASQRSRTIQQRWGATVEVLVIAHDVAVGQPAAEIDWNLERRPVAFVASDALRELPTSSDTVVRPLHSGDVVTKRDLRSSSPAMDPGEGRRAVSVPLDPSVPPLIAGDRVDLFLIDDAFGGGDRRDVEQLQSIGVVLDVDAEAATLSIASTDVQALAHTALNGRVVIALR